jgi:hypothetical protein
MPVQKIVPRSLNLDDDFLVVANSEMVDAMNVTVSADDTGNANILKMAQGTSAVPFAGGQGNVTGGTNRTVGSVINKADNNVYFFVANNLEIPVSTIIVNIVSGQYIHTVTPAEVPHVVSVGDVITVSGMTNSSRDNGTFIVRTVPTANTFTYVSGAVTPTGTNLAGASAKCLVGRHSIYCYLPRTNTSYLAYRNAALGFTAETFVKADTIVKENGDTILYFTDGVNEPRKINVTRALQTRNSGVFSSPLGALPAEFESTSSPTPLNSDIERWDTLICTAKQPPLIAPTFSFVADAKVNNNNIFDKYFQFACQYIYDDGEVSAISPYSTIAISNEQFLDGFLSEQQKRLTNIIRLSVSNSTLDVSKIRILGRNKNDGQFFVIDDIANNKATATSTYDFKNDRSYSFLADSEVNKLYDNVPQIANAQGIVSNRLMYGGYTEFYDNVVTDVDSFVRYNDESKFNLLTVTVPNASPVFGTTPARFTINLDKLGAFVNKFDTVDVDIILNPDYITVNSTNPFAFSYNSPSGVVNTTFSALRLVTNAFTISKTLEFNQYTPIASVRTQLRDLIQGTYSIGVTPTFDVNNPAVNNGATLVATNTYAWFQGTIDFEIYNYAVSGTSITFDVRLKAYDLTSFVVYDSSAGVPISNDPGGLGGGQINLDQAGGSPSISSWTNMKLKRNFSKFYTATGYRTFKSGFEHEFGIVYYDNKNRSGGVNPIPPVYVQSFGERLNGQQGPSSVVCRLKHDPPDWAKRWQLVYAPFTKYNFVLQYTAFEALFETEENPTSTNDRKLYVSAHQFEGRSDSYKEAKGALLDYGFVEGDILRIVKYRSGSGSTAYDIYPKNYEYKIISYDYYDANNTPLDDDSDPKFEQRKVGWFLQIRDEGLAGFTAAEIADNSSFWGNNCIVEIIRPVKTTDKPVYREFGYSYAVDNPSPNVYRHRGDRDYTFVAPVGVPFEVLGMRGIWDTPVYENDIVTVDGVDVYVTDLKLVNTSAGLMYNFSLGSQVIEPGSIFLDGTYNIQINNLEDAVILVDNGDSYFRPRQLKINGDISTRNSICNNVDVVTYSREYIEDNNISDFTASFAHDFGRPNTIVDNAAQVYRVASITYSDPYAIDSSVMTLSSFNLSTANFNDYSNKYGAIKYIHSNDDSIFVIQERKSSIIPVGRNIVEYADGSSSLTVSNNILGAQNYYAGDYGVNDNPESVVERDGRLYFCDIVAAKVLRLGGDGITPISSYKVESFIAETFKNAFETGNKYKVVSLYDPDKDYYMFSINPITGSSHQATMSFDANANVWISKYSFFPMSGQAVGNYLLSFSGSVAYRHTDDQTAGLVYGTTLSASFSIVCNDNPSQVKVFKSISQESNKPFGFTVDNSKQTSMAVPSTDFTNVATAILDAAGNTIGLGFQQTREGIYYAEIPRDTTNTTQAMVVIGSAASVGGDTITFSSSVLNIPFEFGKPVAMLTGGAFVNQGYNVTDVVNYNTIRVSGAPSGAIVGSVMAVRSENAVNGDSMRDRYARVAFSGLTGAFELYAVNVNYAESKLHFA